jgi:hypothetical protein
MSEYDVYILSGFLLVAFGLISVFSASVDGRKPTFGAVLVLIGCGALYMASTLAPQGMKFADVPDAFIRLAAQFFN